MQRLLALALAGICVFAIVAAALLRLMPGPLKDSDYMVIGSVATLLALLVLFVVLRSTSLKSRNAFFKKRRK
jgi:hypothetical protein